MRYHHVGAQFAYLLDAAALEGRHWNNDGVVEDVATGEDVRSVRVGGGVAFVAEGRLRELPPG
ncbi:hypothetical protein [Streptomyces sp. NRRL F-2580]|uniref:hypothetical protein n=1 Tax=Streptomyces sp. NRRL F-2580 TaxID=1463841 RepID=UPI0004C85681|nr:hypothetical protein [Streptomyces sp. NRRL F-2580]